jgi:ribosome biogenesis protein BMS1
VREETVAGYDSSRFRMNKLHSRSYYKLLVKSKFVTGGDFNEEEKEEGEEGEEEEGEGDDENEEIEEEDEEDDEGDDEEGGETKKEKAEKRKKKEEEKEAKIAAEKKEKLDMRNKLKDQLLDLDYGVYRKGLYVRIEIDGIKYKHFRNFKPDFPVTLWDTFGFLKVRLKKHRWYLNVLKSNDPLIFSIGWRRFQSLPVYCREDFDSRLRYAKYTP